MIKCGYEYVFVVRDGNYIMKVYLFADARPRQTIHPNVTITVDSINTYECTFDHVSPNDVLNFSCLVQSTQI